MKRLSALILILALLLSACGISGNSAAGAQAVSTEPGSTPTPKFAYRAEFTSLPKSADGMDVLLRTADGYYAASMEKTGEDIPQSVIDEARKKNKEVVNDGRYDVFGISLFHISDEGEMTRLAKYRQLDDEENTNSWKNFKSVSEICGMARMGDGTLITVERTYISASSAPDRAEDYEEGTDYNEFHSTWYVRTLDGSSGEIKSEHKIAGADGMFFYPSSMIYADGKVYCISSSDTGQGVTAISPDGTVGITALYVGELKKLITLNTGEPAVFARRDDGMFISALNTGNGVFTDLFRLASNVENVYSGTGDDLFFFSNGRDFYGFNFAESADEKLFSFASADVNPTRIISDISCVPDGQVFFMTGEYSNRSFTRNLVRLERSSYDENTDRKVVLIFSDNPSQPLADMIAGFNRENSVARLEITDDISGADIIDLTNQNYRALSVDGKLEDLYPYIDADAGIKREDCFENILSALEVDGKLYQSVAGFYINTVIGESAVVGDGCFWNYDSYYAALASMGEGCDAFDVYAVRDDIFRECLANDLDWFVSWEGRYTNFDNENFRKMLEFVNTFPATFDSAGHEWNDASDNSDLRIADGRQMLLRTSICTFDDVCRCGYEFPGDISFIGYPTSNGTGNSAVAVSLPDGANFAISAASRNKEEAWSFIRTFFTGEYQKKLQYFPVNRNVLDERLKDYRLEYLVDDDGETMYDKKTGEPLKRALGTMYLSDYTEVYYYGLDEGKEAKFINLVTSVNKVADYDEKVYKIINSTCAGYFSGKESSEQACEKVQRKMTEYLYVSIDQKQ